MLILSVVPVPAVNALILNTGEVLAYVILPVTPPSKVLATKSLFLPALNIVEVLGVDKVTELLVIIGTS